MSFTRFFKECSSLLGPYNAATYKQDVLRSHELVRDRWLAKGDYSALIPAILGTCTDVEFISPATSSMLESGEVLLHRKLWAKVVKRQVDDFFNEYSYLRGQKLTYDEILSVDTSNIDPSNYGNYDDKRAASSFLLKILQTSLSAWQRELETHNLSHAEVAQIQQSIKILKRPKIAVPR